MFKFLFKKTGVNSGEVEVNAEQSAIQSAKNAAKESAKEHYKKEFRENIKANLLKQYDTKGRMRHERDTHYTHSIFYQEEQAFVDLLVDDMIAKLDLEQS